MTSGLRYNLVLKPTVTSPKGEDDRDLRVGFFGWA